MELSAQADEWDELARLDPHWAVLSAPGRRGGGWDPDAFMAGGEAEVARLLDRAASHGFDPSGGSALDFGCGIGRLTPAMAARFERVVGVDISEEMLERARSLNGERDNVVYRRNEAGDLGFLADREFDLVYSGRVLQHLPGRAAILAAVNEMARVLAPGGLLVFQLPESIAPARRLQPRRRAYRGLRRLGVPAGILYRRLRLQPIRMSSVDREAVCSALRRAGLRLIATNRGPKRRGGSTLTYWATRD